MLTFIVFALGLCVGFIIGREMRLYAFDKTLLIHSQELLMLEREMVETAEPISAPVIHPPHKGPTHYTIQHDDGNVLYDGYDSGLALAAWESITQDHAPITSPITWIENGKTRDRREVNA